MRRNNLILHGLNEEDEENSDSLRARVSQVLSETLLIDCPAIERCHRLGRSRVNHVRPVIMKLLDFRDKIKVMKNVSKFKGSDWYVTEDYSQSVRSVRKKLWDASASFRNSGSEVRLRFDKLFIDAIQYTLDATSNTLVKVPSRQSSRHPAPTSGSSSPP